MTQLRRAHPDVYRSLRSRYPEAFFAIDDDCVNSFFDATDVDVEEELWFLRADLIELKLIDDLDQ